MFGEYAPGDRIFTVMYVRTGLSPRVLKHSSVYVSNERGM